MMSLLPIDALPKNGRKFLTEFDDALEKMEVSTPDEVMTSINSAIFFADAAEESVRLCSMNKAREKEFSKRPSLKLLDENDSMLPPSSCPLHDHLHEQETKQYPSILDSLCAAPDFQLTTNSAVQIRHLARTFKHEALLEKTWDFIKKDMTPANAETYLRDAMDLGDMQTASWVAFECARNPDQLQKDSPLLKLMCPADFLQFISLASQCGRGHSNHRSELAYAYCMLHSLEIDGKWFRKVTTKNNLPSISPRVAYPLIKIGMFLLKRSGHSAPACAKQLTSLGRRCSSYLKKRLAENAGRSDSTNAKEPSR